jgi:hypothetical protein
LVSMTTLALRKTWKLRYSITYQDLRGHQVIYIGVRLPEYQ